MKKDWFLYVCELGFGFAFGMLLFTFFLWGLDLL